jgi:hypothetical protein
MSERTFSDVTKDIADRGIKEVYPPIQLNEFSNQIWKPPFNQYMG